MFRIKMKKKSVAQITTITLIILVTLGILIIAWNFIEGMFDKETKKMDTEIIQVKLSIDENLVFVNKEKERLQLSLNRGSDDVDLGSLKIILMGIENSNNYFITEYPKPLETKTYLLDTKNIGEIKELLAYPVSKLGITGVGEKIEISGNKDTIDESLTLIEPFENPNTCYPAWNCEEWNECHVVYSLNSVLEDTVFLDGIQEKLCKDYNNCFPDTFEEKQCETRASIGLKKIEKCNKQYLGVYDKDNVLISRLNLIKGRLDIQFIFDNTEYYSYCYNGIKDCDEDGIDCVYSPKDSCPFCR